MRILGGRDMGGAMLRVRGAILALGVILTMAVAVVDAHALPAARSIGLSDASNNSNVQSVPSANNAWLRGVLMAPKKGQKVDAPRVLTLDLGRLQERYDNPGLTGDAAQTAHDNFSRILQPILQQLLLENEGTLLLDRGMFLTDVKSADITDLAFTRLDAAYPPPRPAAAVSEPPQRPTAMEPVMLVADVGKLREAARVVYGEQTDPPISQALDGVMQFHHARMIANRDAIIMATIDIEVTREVLSLVQGNRINPDSQAVSPEPSRVVCIDRKAVLANSLAGKSIASQFEALVSQAKAEFKRHRDQMAQEAEVLKKEADRAPHKVWPKINDFERREKVFEQEMLQRETEMENGVLAARSQIEQALEPILVAMVRDHGANIIIDKSAVVAGNADIDITAEAIEALDEVLTAPRVERLKNLPSK
jgi:Skp family chaperone for outer membrane proteins